MTKFYMTFGCGHPFGGYCLVLIADDESQARSYMHEYFNGYWCGTYSEEQWSEMKAKGQLFPIEKELKTIDIRGWSA